MPCPVCLVEFIVPEGGLSTLPRNPYIETIVGIQRRARHLKSAAATAAASVATQAASAAGTVDSGRRSCTSVVQSAKDHADDWPAPPAGERGNVTTVNKRESKVNN